MLLSYVVREKNGQEAMELCFVPREPNQYASLVPVHLLQDNPTAVYYIGPKEGVNVNRIDQSTRVVTAIEPAVIFLTPDAPDRPGQKAQKLKIVEHPNDELNVFFCRDTGENWEPWVANRKRE